MKRQTLLLRAFTTLVAAGLVTASMAQQDAASDRGRMVEEIDRMVAASVAITGVARLDKDVRAAMAEVPRHEFVPLWSRPAAYENRPLSIGHDQTISQPLIVALMTQLLRPKKTDKVLEVGTGSGYQAAILSVLALEVCTIEIVPELGEMARANLERLGYTNVRTKVGDGYQGWAKHAPFDAIIVTAAPEHIPPALITQLKPGGRMVVPVGRFVQELMVLTKSADGSTATASVGPVRFVPLTQK
jgi:protein-L-isoaspartate(D-aspartate) O-methyltransferase